jgi:hypothetical protein
VLSSWLAELARTRTLGCRIVTAHHQGLSHDHHLVKSALTGDRPLHLRRRLGFIAAGVASYLLLLVLQQHPTITERLYSTAISPVIARALSRLSGLVPFSLFEIVVGSVVSIALVRLVLGVHSIATRRRRFSNACISGIHWVCQGAGILVTLFYALWGLNYVRPALEVRLALSRGSVATTDEIARLARQLVDAGEMMYVELHGKADAGVPTRLPDDRRIAIAALDSGWGRATRALGLSATSARRFGAPKSPWSSTAARYMGISGGMYFPLTGEALVVRDLPAPQFIKTMAHEQAHQRGTAVEGDANALAYFVCVLSPHPLVRYAGLSFARDQMLLELARRDPKRWREEWARMGPGVQRDRKALRDYWARTSVPVDELANKVNDASLRANRVRGGVQSYGRSTLILIEYARRHGGRVVPS